MATGSAHCPGIYKSNLTLRHFAGAWLDLPAAYVKKHFSLTRKDNATHSQEALLGQVQNLRK